MHTLADWHMLHLYNPPQILSLYLNKLRHAEFFNKVGTFYQFDKTIHGVPLLGTLNV